MRITTADLAAYAEELGTDPGRILNDIRDDTTGIHTGMRYGSMVKTMQIRNRYLARSARDAARSQPEHATDWEAVAGMLRAHAGGGVDATGLARILLEGLQ